MVGESAFSASVPDGFDAGGHRTALWECFLRGLGTFRLPPTQQGVQVGAFEDGAL